MIRRLKAGFHQQQTQCCRSQSQRAALKVGTHEGTSPCNLPHKGFTQTKWSQELIQGTVHTKHFEKQVAGSCPKNSNWFEFVGLVTGTKF